MWLGCAVTRGREEAEPRPFWRRSHSVAATRAWRRSDLRATLMERRLHVSGLPRATVALLALAGAVGLGLAIMLVVDAAHRDEALRIEVPATYVGRPWPAPFIAVVLLGFATAQAVVVWLGEQFSSRGRAAMHVGILLTGVIPVLFARHQIGLTAGIYDARPAGPTRFVRAWALSRRSPRSRSSRWRCSDAPD